MSVSIQITPLGDDDRVELVAQNYYSRRVGYLLLATDLKRTQEKAIYIGDRMELQSLRDACNHLLQLQDTPTH